MPIYEYRCNACGCEFEKIVRGQQQIHCSACGSAEVAKKMSVFGMSGVEKQTASGCSSCTSGSCSTCK